jgi:hypothetical protein
MEFMSAKFAHCHFDETTGLVWCHHHNGSWAPPFKVSTTSSSVEYVKTPSEDSTQDEVDTKTDKD